MLGIGIVRGMPLLGRIPASTRVRVLRLAWAGGERLLRRGGRRRRAIAVDLVDLVVMQFGGDAIRPAVAVDFRRSCVEVEIGLRIGVAIELRSLVPASIATIERRQTREFEQRVELRTLELGGLTALQLRRQRRRCRSACG